MFTLAFPLAIKRIQEEFWLLGKDGGVDVYDQVHLLCIGNYQSIVNQLHSSIQCLFFKKVLLIAHRIMNKNIDNY